MQDVLDKFLTASVLFMPRVIGSLVILAAFWIASIVLQSLVVKIASGFNMSALVAGLGLSGFVLGFALKDVFANVVAGALILSYRPFRTDDHVSVAGFDGLVTEIDMRYTTIQADDRRILVPNSTVMTSPVSVFKK